MHTRANYFPILKALNGFAAHLSKSSVEKSLLELVYFRVSQINGCAFCLDMHAKELRDSGEAEQRLYVLNAWQEAPFYSDRERAALALAEAITKLTGCQIAEDVYAAAAAQFTEPELLDLVLGIIAINSYNRLNITFGSPVPVGSYQVGQFA